MQYDLEIKLSERHLEAMNQAVNILAGELYAEYVDAIYLYGSCARGKQRYHSDVDLLVQCPETVSSDILRSMSIAVMPERTELPEVELKFVRGEKWKAGNDCFSRNLVKEGIKIWEKT